ncbi:uracil-DNA glycosylase [Psychromonas sp. Urea-02u-13]|uniref:uracil-DNA glycosylase n=1 Tax=Psychromonas sp. Urea-02u-13 TaxID=2058326 RepID=UPI000C32D1A4|nr:uracil-DNA glycosylase [Psychromonas sp. Urea-02u-13]PKG38271.1 uracil-DNA glycosylase [Psychromonas sp. Urea-02u-13]
MNWQKFIQLEKQKAYYQALSVFLENQTIAGKEVYPSEALYFNALDLCPLENVKVVILGQDPYHGEGQAHGLSFSVPDGVKVPPSLRNIYKELADSIDGFEVPESGNLTHWAEQGVLLLNAVLSVEKSNAGSHAKQGWETFTDNVIKQLNESQSGVIFLLWGGYAHKKGLFIDEAKHTILKSVHPSPLSAYRGFLGCGHFKEVNEILTRLDKNKINW